MINSALGDAYSLLSFINQSSSTLSSTNSTLLDTLEAAEEILSLPALPSEEARSTARKINDTFIPQEVVDELEEDAEESSAIVSATLSKANESRSVHYT